MKFSYVKNTQVLGKSIKKLVTYLETEHHADVNEIRYSCIFGSVDHEPERNFWGPIYSLFRRIIAHKNSLCSISNIYSQKLHG